MIKLLFALRALSLAAHIRSVVLFSEFTPPSFPDSFSSVLSSVSSSQKTVEFYQVSPPVLSFLETASIHLIFDFTYSFTYRLSLLKIADSLKIPCFTPEDAPKKGKVHKSTFYLHLHPSFEAQALQNLLQYLQITSYFLISTSDDSSLSLASYVGQPYTIPSVSPQSVYFEYISGTVKTSGNWKVVGVSEPEGCLKMFESIIQAKMYTDLLTFVTNGKGSLNDFPTGVVSVIEEGLEQALNQAEYEAYSVLKALKLVETLDFGRVREDLEDLTINHAIPSNFSIINFNQYNQRETVGKISQEGVQTISQIVFSGNSSSTPSEKPKIRITADLNYNFEDGSLDLNNYSLKRGLVPMVSIINSDDSLLKNFELELIGVDCVTRNTNYSKWKNCIRKYVNEIENYYIDSQRDESLKLNMQILKEFGLDIVHGTAFVDDWDLYKKEAYPDTLITTPHFEYLYSLLPYIIASFGWKNIILFRDQRRTGIDSFIKNCETLGISILNTNRIIPNSIDANDKEAYRDYIQEIIDTKCRIIVSLQVIPDNVYLARALYDYGFRREDIVMITTSRIKIVSEAYMTPNDIEKVSEVLDGSLMMLYKEFTGEYGQFLYEQFELIFYPESPIYVCYFIDTMLLAVRTIDMLINLEFDYTNIDLFKKYIRKQFFKGCNGNVAIDSSSNGPRDIVFGIYNFYEKDGNLTEEYMGYYHLGLLVPLKLDREINWPNGSTQIPSDLIVEFPCRNSSHKTNTTYILQNLILGLGCLFCVIASFGSYQADTEDLKSVRDITFEDGVFLTLPVLEAVQYTGLTGDFNAFFAIFGSLAILDISVTQDYEDETFWRLFGLVSGIVVLWIGCLIVCFWVYSRIPQILKDFVYYIGYIYFAFIAQYGFIPVVLTLLKVLDCGENLNKDCSISCWEGVHLILAVFTFIVLLIYIGASVLLKSEVDNNMEAVSIKTNSLFYFSKCFFHLVLIMLYINKDEYEDFLEVIFFVLFGVWTWFVYKKKLSNYKRLDFWQRLIVLGVVLNRLVVLVFKYVGEPVEVFIGSEFAIIVLIGIYGLIVQRKRYPSMLYRKPGSDIHKLIKFVFGVGVEEKDLTIRDFTYAVREGQEIENRRRNVVIS